VLSPEHVRARRTGKELTLLSLKGPLRQRALELSAALCEIARENLGSSRDELHLAWAEIEVSPKERRLMFGLSKLVEDSCQFEEPEGVDPPELRSDVFLRAAAARRVPDADFDRNAVIASVAEARDTTPDAIEAALFSDLRGAHRLVECNAVAPAAFVEGYERAQVQAVLLRAVRVQADVRCGSPDAYRELFRKLKWRRLLYRAERLPDGGYRLEIDGPFSLFQSVTKYGLELSLTLPALEACDRLELEADIRWSDRGGPLKFRYECARGLKGGGAPAVRDDVRELGDAIAALGSGWVAEPCARIVDLPGVGVCVPDLLLRRTRDGREVLLELLGFWSRDSVWKRVELVEKGLGETLLFAVSSKLRVSEAVLDESEAAALYVFKGKPNASALLRRAEALLARPAKKRRS
jgi:predicted nuclease of restriction endonuclease-like RecB superfamily